MLLEKEYNLIDTYCSIAPANKVKVQQYVDWCLYEQGMMGAGHPSALDKKPDFPKPELPEEVKAVVDKDMEEMKDVKQDAFRKACMDVLGEDPEDWRW